jgi:Ser/Thr protein kinase RdoA (MazF antagonist)
MTVPMPIPTIDGRYFAGGLVVMSHVEGGPPETEADWRRVADTFRELHRLTRCWPQRPGWRSSSDLLHAETGTRIDLGAMPSEAVVRCRAAWARLAGRGRCVVHGDPNPGNIRMTADRVALIDWDETHVDVPDLDLVLPFNAAGLDDDTHDAAAQAWAAWEAAACWDPSGADNFAVRRLAEVRAV